MCKLTSNDRPRRRFAYVAPGRAAYLHEGHHASNCTMQYSRLIALPLSYRKVLAADRTGSARVVVVRFLVPEND